MVTFLYSLPDLWVAILFSCTVALIFATAPLLRLHLLGHVSETNSEIARTSMTTITSFTGVVLAFSLVQAQGNLRAAEKTVASEAQQLNQIDRLLTDFGDANVAAIRNAVHAYAESIVTDEWPKLSEHSSSPRTAELFRTFSRLILAIQPTSARQNVIYSDLVKVTDQLEQSREDRLAETNLGLPAIFWQVIAFLLVLLVGFAAFVEPHRGRALSLGGLGIGLALLITLVFIFDQPFLGDVSVTPEPIDKVVQVMHARTN
jgi:Protein of unknown function (DUF4239)